MSDRIRLVVMGDSRVGKSSIVKRFLFGEFNVKHIPTIDSKSWKNLITKFLQLIVFIQDIFVNNEYQFKDLFSRDFELGEQAGGNGKPNLLKVDILDTAGDAQFPAMRR